MSRDELIAQPSCDLYKLQTEKMQRPILELLAVVLICVAVVSAHPKAQFCDNSSARTDCGMLGDK